MAKNDKILLDGILDYQTANKAPSAKRDEAFEHLAFQQILKDFDLSTDEVLHGSIDGSRDGGIDGFFILVNGHLLQDPEAFIWPKTGSELKVVIATCKHHDTFKQATLDNLAATLSEILSFDIEDHDLKGAYSEALLRMRGNFKYAYRKLSSRLARFSIDIFYASRGDTSYIGEEVASRASQIESLVKDYFGACKSSFVFLGSAELVELHRKMPNYTLELPFVEALTKGERYVVLAKLSDYYEFISDNGRLRRYLFESNVRDFMGRNRVNEDIKTTLESDASPDFWWLNNGVTILATSASIIGKSIQAVDIQIVNGLQTTESIFRHFSNSGGKPDDRCVLIKVIVSQDDVVRDSIIRATNNQTDVELASLHATDKIQRDIEDVLLQHNLYYERRKNFYINQGHAVGEIITPLYVAAGYIALILKIPHKAVALRSKFMRSQEAYGEVFSDRVPLGVWPKIAQLMKRIDAHLETLRPQGRASDKYLKGWRYITALLIVSKHFRRFDFNAEDLSSFDSALVSLAEVEQVVKYLSGLILGDVVPGVWSKPRMVARACHEFSGVHAISGVEAVERRADRSFGEVHKSKGKSFHVSDQLLDKIKESLPPQPWKPGLHKFMCKELGCDTATYFAAVDRLIEDGFVLRQKDGVLFDRDGNVVAFDYERVDPQTLSLRLDAHED